MLAVSAGAALFGPVVGLSALVGGSISVVANYFFARRVWDGKRPESAQRVVLTFYWAELVKIVLAAVLLATAGAAIEQLNEVGLVVGFLVAHIGLAVTLGTGGVTTRHSTGG